MRLVELQNERLELRWTWLPYWMAAGPTLQGEVEALMRDAVIINGLPLTSEAVDRVEAFVVYLLTRRFAFAGLREFLLGLHGVTQV